MSVGWVKSGVKLFRKGLLTFGDALTHSKLFLKDKG